MTWQFDYRLSAKEGDNKVTGHQYQWFTGGYDLEKGHF